MILSCHLDIERWFKLWSKPTREVPETPRVWCLAKETRYLWISSKEKVRTINASTNIDDP